MAKTRRQPHAVLQGLPVLSKPYRIEELAAAFQEEVGRKSR